MQYGVIPFHLLVGVIKPSQLDARAIPLLTPGFRVGGTHAGAEFDLPRSGWNRHTLINIHHRRLAVRAQPDATTGSIVIQPQRAAIHGPVRPTPPFGAIGTPCIEMIAQMRHGTAEQKTFLVSDFSPQANGHRRPACQGIARPVLLNIEAQFADGAEVIANEIARDGQATFTLKSRHRHHMAHHGS